MANAFLFMLGFLAFVDLQITFAWTPFLLGDVVTQQWKIETEKNWVFRGPNRALSSWNWRPKKHENCIVLMQSVLHSTLRAAPPRVREMWALYLFIVKQKLFLPFTTIDYVNWYITRHSCLIPLICFIEN